MAYLANVIGRHPARLGLVMVALLLGGVAIGMALQSSLSSHATASSKGEAEVRIAATPRADGSVRVGLQQSGGDGTWTATEYPQLSIVPADAEPNRTLFSSAVTVATTGHSITLADAYYRYATSASIWLQDHIPDPTLWCLLREADHNETGEAYCRGYVDTLGADSVEIIRYTDLVTTFGALAARAQAGEQPDYFATSELPELFGLLRLSEAEIFFPMITLDPAPPSGDRYCVIGHGDNSFWQLIENSVLAGASHLGVETELDIALTAEERAERIRECVDEGVSAIVVTLAETELVADAIRDARAQGVPVVTYNSGGSSAAESGSLLHLGLDDRQAGVIVGERLTADGVSGPALCLIHEPQNVGLTDRCEGLDESYDEVEALSVVGGFDALHERLASGDVGAVVVLNGADSLRVAMAIQRSGHAPTLAVVGFDSLTVTLMLNRQVQFAVWDHAVLQGYLAVAMAAMAESAFLLPELVLSGAELLIQPSIVTADDLRYLIPGG